MFTAIKTFFVGILIAVGLIHSPVPMPEIVPVPEPQIIVQDQPVVDVKQEPIISPKPITPVVKKAEIPKVAPPVVQVVPTTPVAPVVAPAPVVIIPPTPTPEKKNARCGISADRTAKKFPTENLCDIGTAGSVSESYPGYTWSCAGISGGTTASCSANKPQDGACGAVANTIVSIIDSSKLCTIKDSAPNYMGGVNVNDDQIKWTCSGLYGGQNTTCYAIKAKGQSIGWISYN